MPESFDTETVLKDILDVLRKHGVPAYSVEVDIAMLEADFASRFPDHIPYRFYHPAIIDNVPVLLASRPRLPFDELVRLLQEIVLPRIQEFHVSLVTDYPTLPIRLVERHEPDFYAGENHLFYQISVECQFLEDMREDYNILQLEVTLSQYFPSSYAELDAAVGWRTEWESDGSWVLEVVAKSEPSTNPGRRNIEGINGGLYRRMRQTIDKKLAEGNISSE